MKILFGDHKSYSFYFIQKFRILKLNYLNNSRNGKWRWRWKFKNEQKGCDTESTRKLNFYRVAIQFLFWIGTLIFFFFIQKNNKTDRTIQKLSLCSKLNLNFLFIMYTKNSFNKKIHPFTRVSNKSCNLVLFKRIAINRTKMFFSNFFLKSMKSTKVSKEMKIEFIFWEFEKFRKGRTQKSNIDTQNGHRNRKSIFCILRVAFYGHFTFFLVFFITFKNFYFCLVILLLLFLVSREHEMDDD